jgi:hypothetical protein
MDYENITDIVSCHLRISLLFTDWVGHQPTDYCGVQRKAAFQLIGVPFCTFVVATVEH